MPPFTQTIAKNSGKGENGETDRQYGLPLAAHGSACGCRGRCAWHRLQHGKLYQTVHDGTDALFIGVF